MRQPILTLALLITACSGSTSPTEHSGTTEATGPRPEPESSSAEPEPAAAPADGPAADADFISSHIRCLHISPEGEQLSCEEISEQGILQGSAPEANCRMLSAQLENGDCPTENVVGRCLAMDGPDLRPVYPIRIYHYRSSLIADAARSQALCAELSGTSLPAS